MPENTRDSCYEYLTRIYIRFFYSKKSSVDLGEDSLSELETISLLGSRLIGEDSVYEWLGGEKLYALLLDLFLFFPLRFFHGRITIIF